MLPGKTYQFRVVGNSNNGLGESSNIFEVNTQPEENIAGPPVDVRGFPLSHKMIQITWSNPIVTNGNISKYRIYYSEGEGAEMYTDSTTLEAVLSDLRGNICLRSIKSIFFLKKNLFMYSIHRVHGVGGAFQSKRYVLILSKGGIY